MMINDGDARCSDGQRRPACCMPSDDFLGILHRMHDSGASSACTLPPTLLVCYAAIVLQVCSAHAAAG
jgi:hypothetical protein